MVLEAIVDAVVRLVLVVGLPLLVVLFYVEGLIVGKVLQPPAVFVGVVAVTVPSPLVLGLLVVGCALSATAGQWTIHRSFDDDATELLGVRRTVPKLDRLPTIVLDRISENRLDRVDELFDRYGAFGIVVTNVIPGIRGLLAIPAGVSSYPTGRFLAVTLLGNVLYFALLVAVVYGILQIVGIG